MIARHPSLTILIIEFVFTLLTIILCQCIYRKTQELDELSRDEGIRHFRSAFLFLGITYGLRFLLGILFLFREFFEVSGYHHGYFGLIILLLGYTSTIAIAYLVFHSAWKTDGKRVIVISAHLVAFLLSIIAFVTRNYQSLLFVQTFLLIGAVIMYLRTYKKGKRFTLTRTFYMLLFLFWLINLWMIAPHPRLPMVLRLGLEILSLLVLYMFYRRVVKWTA